MHTSYIILIYATIISFVRQGLTNLSKVIVYISVTATYACILLLFLVRYLGVLWSLVNCCVCTQNSIFNYSLRPVAEFA